MAPPVILYALPRGAAAKEATAQRIEQLRRAGLQVEPLQAAGLVSLLRAKARSPGQVLVADTSSGDALFAAWVVGVPMRVATSKLSWLGRRSATHEVRDTAELAAAITAACPGLSAQAGLPLWLKRALDLSVALPVLIATLPAMAGTALCVRVWLGSPVLFRQARPGKHGRIFRIVKFRTMTDARDASGKLLPDAQRLTRLGKFLRASSLDELPQLLNVVLGQMSLVGPRPLLTSYLERYSAQQLRRHNVLPGITGLAQINGRNATSWDERLRWDVEYADKWSLSMDLAILLRTLTAVLTRRGVSQPGHATMPEFTGSSLTNAKPAT